MPGIIEKLRFMLVGCGFDYLLRFELRRRVPNAVTFRWAAESAPKLAGEPTEINAETSVVMHADLMVGTDPSQYLQPEEVAMRTRAVLDKAKADLAAYLKLGSPTVDEQAKLAAHAIRLAKLDNACRQSRLYPGFEDASEEDVLDLVDLLAVVPFDQLLAGSPLLLNPNFGEASQLVGGADADLIAADMLVDFKVTKSAEIKDVYLDQILGYLLLARKHSVADPNFPQINRLGVYYARHGHLWSVDSAAWTQNPAFSGTEQWFFQRALQMHRPTNLSRRSLKGEKPTRRRKSRSNEDSI